MGETDTRPAHMRSGQFHSRLKCGQCAGENSDRGELDLCKRGWWGLPRWLRAKESICQCRRRRRHGFDPWVRKIPWSKKWQPIVVFLPGKSHGQRSLVGYSPWGCKESDMIEQLGMHARAYCKFSQQHVQGFSWLMKSPGQQVHGYCYRGKQEPLQQTSR